VDTRIHRKRQSSDSNGHLSGSIILEEKEDSDTTVVREEPIEGQADTIIHCIKKSSVYACSRRGILRSGVNGVPNNTGEAESRQTTSKVVQFCSVLVTGQFEIPGNHRVARLRDPSTKTPDEARIEAEIEKLLKAQKNQKKKCQI
jgi:hypothetical protein